MPRLPLIQPSSVTLMIKPVGALCNLDCEYCYYLPTKDVYAGREHRMRLDTLESVFAGFLPHAGDEVTVTWQGGEPTLAGLAFFEQAVAFQAKHARPGQRIANALQTNATLIDDRWAKFLRTHRFLVGVSVDGPAHLHDRYRLTNTGAGSHDAVMRGLKTLQQHGVEYNILCVLSAANVDKPDEVLGYLLNLGSRWLQFIPEVVFEPDPQRPDENRLAEHCPDPRAYGTFMARVFDLWFERYRQRVSVRLFDAVLQRLVTGRMPFCILDGSCHGQVTIEHNGDVFGCDHFVERRWQLAQIGQPDWQNDIDLEGKQEVGLTIHGTGYRPNTAHAGRDIGCADDVNARYTTNDNGGQTLDTGWFGRADAERLSAFAARKQKLAAQCEACEWLACCYGGCPEHRPRGGETPEPSVLCEGYIRFYEHAMERLAWLAGYLRRGQPPPPVERNVGAGAARDSAVGRAAPVKKGKKTSRNAPCPCGSGLKFKNCCGRVAG